MPGHARAKVERFVMTIGRLALAIIFLYAAYAKLRPQAHMPWSIASVKTSLSMFAMGVDSYELLSPQGVHFVAHWLPPFELFLGLWLLSGIALRFSSLSATLLLGGFLAVQIRSFSLGQEISCGCFGPGERIGPWSLLRDILIILLSISVLVCAFRVNRRRDTPSVESTSTAGT
jgi:uncharacterized membrane protein YphA (DoxX/SURF4 family)